MSEEAREEERQRRIQRAKDFAERMIYGQELIATKEDHALMIISSFLLIKEHIIKKDTKNGILYVDLPNATDYFGVMEKIVSFITRTSNNINVDLLTVVNIQDGKPLPTNETQIIIIMNKVRNALAHNDYNFDESYTNIIINNEYTEDGKTYTFKVTIPINLLELLIFAANNDYEKQIVEEYQNSRGIILKSDSKSDLKLASGKEKHPNESHIAQKENNPIIYMNSKLEESDLDQDTKGRRISKELLVFLENLSKEIKTDSRKKEICFLLEKYGTEKELSRITIVDISKDDFDMLAIRNIIRELSRILNMGDDRKTQMKLIALFNYMQTIFTTQDTEYKSLGLEEKQKRRFHLLKLHSIKPTINPEISDSIKKEVTRYINISKNIRNIYKYKNTEKEKLKYKKDIINALKVFIERINKALTNQNAEILTRIRNAVMHANISEELNVITLQDLPDKSEPNKPTFYCHATIDELMDITKKIEQPDLLVNNLTDDEMLKELIYFGQLTEDEVESLKDIIQAVNEIIFDSATNYSLTEICEQAARMGL